MAYCSIQAARDAGATGTDAEVTAWITAAQERIEQYTQQVFEPTPMVVVADVGADGLVILPRRVRQVAAVAPVLADEGEPTIPPAAYRVTSADTLGQVDAVHLAWGGWDDLVAGAESYNGGWLGLWERWGTEQVRVTGEFGYAQVPPLVAQACALLTASLQTVASPTDPDAPGGGLDVDDEGNNVRIEDEDATAGPLPVAASTGSPKVDGLLVGYLNRTSWAAV